MNTKKKRDPILLHRTSRFRYNHMHGMHHGIYACMLPTMQEPASDGTHFQERDDRWI